MMGESKAIGLREMELTQESVDQIDELLSRPASHCTILPCDIPEVQVIASEPGKVEVREVPL